MKGDRNQVYSGYILRWWKYCQVLQLHGEPTQVTIFLQASAPSLVSWDLGEKDYSLPREASPLRPSGWPFCPFLISNCIFSAWLSWLSILFVLDQSTRNKKSKEQNNGKERMVKCHYNPCEPKLTQTFQTEFLVCLNLSGNCQFNLHIDFIYLLFRSKETIYL